MTTDAAGPPEDDSEDQQQTPSHADHGVRRGGLAPWQQRQLTKALARMGTFKAIDETLSRAGFGQRAAGSRSPSLVRHSVYYRRVAARRGGKRALVALMRKIAIAIWHVLKHKVVFHDLGADYLPQRDPERAMNRIRREANRLGLTVRFDPITHRMTRGKPPAGTHIFVSDDHRVMAACALPAPTSPNLNVPLPY